LQTLVVLENAHATARPIANPAANATNNASELALSLVVHVGLGEGGRTLGFVGSGCGGADTIGSMNALIVGLKSSLS